MKPKPELLKIVQAGPQRWEVRDHRNVLLGVYRARNGAGELVRKLQAADAFAKQFAKEHS